jgi:hypothetical protein
MTHAEFDAILNRRIDLCRSVLAGKAGEYAAGGDRLHNFKRSADRRGTSTAEALLGMLSKHWTSIEDLVAAWEAGEAVSGDRIDEKIGDAVNYLILLEGVLREERP